MQWGCFHESLWPDLDELRDVFERRYEAFHSYRHCTVPQPTRPYALFAEHPSWWGRTTPPVMLSGLWPGTVPDARAERGSGDCA